MVNFFHRTSTHRVYEIILNEGITDLDIISSKLRALGHKRRINDIKQMIRLLEKFGLLEDRLMNIAKLLIKGNYNNPPEALIFLANEFLEEMMERGLLLKPFLEAVGAFPNKNRLIQYEFVDRSASYGFYNQRIGDDISAAMRNFAGLLNLTVLRSGRYELTPLGRALLDSKKPIYARTVCDFNEPCRVVCPAGAISAFSINVNCIACGLCLDACPYGALSINCEKTPQLDFNPEVCKSSQGASKNPLICSMNKLLGEELVLQRWIKGVMGMASIHAEIPGVGEYPDLVTFETPAFLEVKKSRITGKGKKRIIEQLIRYSQEEVIRHTLEQLKRFTNLNWKEPNYLIVVSPRGGEEKALIRSLEKEIIDKILGFISINKFYNLAQNYYSINKEQRQKLSLVQLFE